MDLILLAVGGMEGPWAVGQMCPLRGASPESVQDQLTLGVWLGDFRPLEGKVFKILSWENKKKKLETMVAGSLSLG